MRCMTRFTGRTSAVMPTTLSVTLRGAGYGGLNEGACSAAVKNIGKSRQTEENRTHGLMRQGWRRQPGISY